MNSNASMTYSARTNLLSESSLVGDPEAVYSAFVFIDSYSRITISASVYQEAIHFKYRTNDVVTYENLKRRVKKRYRTKFKKNTYVLNDIGYGETHAEESELTGTDVFDYIYARFKEGSTAYDFAEEQVKIKYSKVSTKETLLYFDQNNSVYNENELLSPEEIN